MTVTTSLDAHLDPALWEPTIRSGYRGTRLYRADQVPALARRLARLDPPQRAAVIASYVGTPAHAPADHSQAIRALMDLLDRGDLTVGEMLRLTASDGTRVIEALLEHPSTPYRVIKHAALRAESPHARIAAVRTGRLTRQHLGQLAADRHPSVRAAVARHRNLSARASYRLAADTQPIVARAVAANPAAPENARILAALNAAAPAA